MQAENASNPSPPTYHGSSSLALMRENLLNPYLAESDLGISLLGEELSEGEMNLTKKSYIFMISLMWSASAACVLLWVFVTFIVTIGV